MRPQVLELGTVTKVSGCLIVPRDDLEKEISKAYHVIPLLVPCARQRGIHFWRAFEVHVDTKNF